MVGCVWFFGMTPEANLAVFQRTPDKDRVQRKQLCLWDLLVSKIAYARNPDMSTAVFAGVPANTVEWQSLLNQSVSVYHNGVGHLAANRGKGFIKTRY
jgi:hypothetical protein